MMAEVVDGPAEKEKMNLPFDIPLEKIEDILGIEINGDHVGYDRVIPPRGLARVHDISLLRDEVVLAMIKGIPLRGREVYPYRDSQIKIFRTEPYGFDIGQTFILEGKILGIMQNLEGKLFSGFSTRGISKMPPVKFYGEDAEGEKAIAFYLPPFVEHQDRVALIDGIHRSYLCGSAGTTINAVHIYGVSHPLPFDTITWQNAALVKEKPSKDKRYVNLRPELFRDLGAVGIDG
jgi:hypothetical protein